MPWSGSLLDEEAKQFFTLIKGDVEKVLDVGCGAGKYGKLWHSIKPVEVRGVEIEADYIHRFSKEYEQYYSRIIQADIMGILEEPEIAYDLVIFGDVLEHLFKSEGLDLLNFLVYRTKYIYIQYPRHYLQNPSDIEGYRHEAHVSVWQMADFASLDTTFVSKEAPPLVAVAIDGYIAHSVRTTEWK